MLGIGAPEIMMLVLLGVIFFGPEKVPEISRKAARVIFFLRGVANNAQNQLRAELGPEYADLQLTDLHPKTFVQKHLLDGIQDDLDEIKADLSEVRSDLDGELKDAQLMGEELRHELERSDAGAAGQLVPSYADAT